MNICLFGPDKTRKIVELVHCDSCLLSSVKHFSYKKQSKSFVSLHKSLLGKELKSSTGSACIH